MKRSWVRQFFSVSSCAFTFTNLLCIKISAAVLAMDFCVCVFMVFYMLRTDHHKYFDDALDKPKQEAPFRSQCLIIKWNLNTPTKKANCKKQFAKLILTLIRRVIIWQLICTKWLPFSPAPLATHGVALNPSISWSD